MSANATSQSLRVLLVEDSLPNRTLMKHLLRSYGCEVTIAVNGVEGVERFAESTFDVVLMDIQMPLMDGLTATKIIRHHETGLDKRVTIIAVTAGFDRETCLEAGMDDHVLKPVRPETLYALLDELTGVESSS